MPATPIATAVEQLDVARFWKNGFAIVRGVYSPEEVAGFREAAWASLERGGDLLASPRLRSVVTDGRMVAVARRLLGTDDLVYTGDSSFTVNGTQRGWHKDNTDRVDPKAPDWDSRYTQLRFGIYCQDHSEHTGGLNLRVGSHDIANTTGGDTFYVKSRPGDLAVWSMRITHSGNGMLLKDPAAPYPLPDDHAAYRPDEVAEADGDRIALFVHIGANDAHAKRYADYTKTRRYLVEAWRRQPWDDDARAAAAEAGLTLRDLPAEVADDPQAGADELWQPFPYERPVPPMTPSQRAATAARRVVRTARGAARGALDGWSRTD